MTVLPSGDVWPSDEFSTVVLEAFDLGVNLQAIGIRYSGVPQCTLDGTDCWALVKEICWEGPDWREYLVKLADATTGDALTYYAPNTLAKVGTKKPRQLPLGQVSQHRALTAAHWFLSQSVNRLLLRTYGTSTPPSPLPGRGQTVMAGDGFAGVCLSRSFDQGMGGEEYLEVRLLDMTSGLDT